MRKARLFVATALATGCLAAVAPAASAGEVCYSVQVVVQGGDVVDERGCIQTP